LIISFTTAEGVNMGLITREEAKEQGLSKYFTGKPCKHGHVAERYVSRTSCVMCHSGQMKKYCDKDRGKIAKMHKDWCDKNPQKAHDIKVNWAKANKARVKEIQARAYRKKKARLALDIANN
jgi:hypothetical protein